MLKFWIVNKNFNKSEDYWNSSAKWNTLPVFSEEDDAVVVMPSDLL